MMHVPQGWKSALSYYFRVFFFQQFFFLKKTFNHSSTLHAKKKKQSKGVFSFQNILVLGTVAFLFYLIITV
jgi:hypothetical protein